MHLDHCPCQLLAIVFASLPLPVAGHCNCIIASCQLLGIAIASLPPASCWSLHLHHCPCQLHNDPASCWHNAIKTPLADITSFQPVNGYIAFESTPHHFLAFRICALTPASSIASSFASQEPTALHHHSGRSPTVALYHLTASLRPVHCAILAVNHRPFFVLHHPSCQSPAHALHWS